MRRTTKQRAGIVAKERTKEMYEASKIVAIGDAHDLILGQKPFELSTMDSEGISNRMERQMDDIDEADE